MTLSRRRFLAISAACAATPAFAQRVERWRGHALGAQVEITLSGHPDQTTAALRAARSTLRRIESRFSLYDPASELSRLNATGALVPPSALMRKLVAASADAHDLTGGLFDPSVQPIWLARARAVPNSALVDWSRLRLTPDGLRLSRGQQLTFNGIAQGFATDQVRDALLSHGLGSALVNIGEFAAIGGPFTLGLEDATHGFLGHRTLLDTAIATSSPAAMTFDTGLSHIINPRKPDAPARWSTVSIEARSATLADALSTAMVHGDLALARRLRAHPDILRISLVSANGDLTTL